jgi:hypothetical protein
VWGDCAARAPRLAGARPSALTLRFRLRLARHSPDLSPARQDALNEVLVHAGLRVNDQGKIARGVSVSTLSEAAKHASAPRTELRRRGTHQQVLAYCTEEILAKNALRASLEASKSVADRLRKMTGQHLDGARLVDAVLTAGQSGAPNVAIYSHSTPRGPRTSCAACSACTATRLPTTRASIGKSPMTTCLSC